MLAEMLANRFFERTLSTKKPRLSGASARADERIRTADPFITSEVLYQLSYVGKGPNPSGVRAPSRPMSRGRRSRRASWSR